MKDNVPKRCNKCGGTGYIDENKEYFTITFYKNIGGLNHVTTHGNADNPIKFLNEGHAISIAKAELLKNEYDSYIISPNKEK